MRVSDAVATRRSVRAYLDRPVSRALLEALVMAAAHAPSGGNLQPWHVELVLGRRLAALKTLMREHVRSARQDDRLDVEIYPEPLGEPFHGRRRDIGEAMYRSLGIARSDKAARVDWFLRNFELFGAPAAIFVHIDRRMGRPQWADLGMFVQSLLLLCLEAGLATCPQECWALYPRTLGDFLGLSDDRILFCGIAVGYEDAAHPSAALRSERAEATEFLRVHET